MQNLVFYHSAFDISGMSPYKAVFEQDSKYNMNVSTGDTIDVVLTGMPTVKWMDQKEVILIHFKTKLRQDINHMHASACACTSMCMHCAL